MQDIGIGSDNKTSIKVIRQAIKTLFRHFIAHSSTLLWRATRSVKVWVETGIPLSTVLETERLRLRAINQADIDVVWSATRFEGFNNGMDWDPPMTKDELIPITVKNLESWAVGLSYAFTIVLKADNLAVGRIALTRQDELSTWNIGFWVHPDHWRNGYATEAAAAAIEFGFKILGASAITAAHAVWNVPSKRVIEKLGFRFTGENPCGYMKHGQPVAEFEYVLDPADH